jgi:hypothetical protein
MKEKITKFKAGDLVPDWVLQAPKSELQCEASFCVDVEVHHGESVDAYPSTELGDTDCLVRITAIGAVDGWKGAPTIFHGKIYIPDVYHLKF